VAPAVLLIGLVFLYPIVQVIRYSFYAGSTSALTYVGTANYRNVVHDPGLHPLAAQQPQAAAHRAGDDGAGAGHRADAQRRRARLAPVPGDRLPAVLLPATAIGLTFSYLLAAQRRAQHAAA
jgi:ABC-type sugar transport system permease subunit